MSIKIAIFCSGSGSNAENIMQHFAEDNNVNILLILSNKSDAQVHKRAKKFNVPSITFSKNDLINSDNVLNILKKQKIDLIILAGFLLKIPQNIIKTFPEKIINIHPALLPKYGGKGMYGQHVHEAVVANKEKESGITIHYVTEHYDKGNIIFQATCKLTPTDTPDEVATKIHELEYQYFPKVIEKITQKIQIY